MNANDMNTETAANDLTQLSSREQLSALMDGALPPDQTRFLLRRLQHDTPLAECWQRWRMTGEVMRGLAPARRLPADFAARVSASLHGEAEVAQQAGSKRSPVWLRWGGGAAMAASLALVALMARQPAMDADAASQQAAASSSRAIELSASPAPASQAPSPREAGDARQTLVATAAVAAATTQRPARHRAAEQARAPARVQTATTRDEVVEMQVAAAGGNGVLGASTAILPPEIVNRPWPRSVLPQYASGGLTVGFGDHARGATAYNPFHSQAGIGSLPPITANADDAEAARAPQAAAAASQP
jgi:negative regulator of sigma E activity